MEWNSFFINIVLLNGANVRIFGHEGIRLLPYSLIPRDHSASYSIYGLCGTLTEVTGWDYWIRRVIPERNGQSNHLSALEYSCISPPT